MGILNGLIKGKEESAKLNKPQKIFCRMELRDNLDDEQRKAVEAPIGNVCVFAVAGSGKTRVLTYRVANLIDNSIPENEMLLLTFTNKAAGEMQDRIKQLLGKKQLDLLAGTFHSVASTILRSYANKIGLPTNFNIITPVMQRSLLENCRSKYMESYMSEESDDSFPSKVVLADIYSGAINHGKTFREYIKEYYSYFDTDIAEGVLLIFTDYVERKDRERMVDFDDLLLNLLDVLKNEEARKEINEKFKHIFVDEYQDINWMQYQILEYLNGNDSLFVIGDAKQCIYQFRGSKSEYIDIFKKTHSDVDCYSLTFSYRSTPEILNMASEVITYNTLPEKVVIRTKNEEGELPYIFGHDDEEKEVEKIAELIIENQYSFNDVAILVRRGAQISIVQKAMRKYRIPCNLVGGVSIYESEHIQDILAFLQLWHDNTNEAAFLRAAKIFAGIGAALSEDMYDKLKKCNYDYHSAASLMSERQRYAFQTIIRILEYPCKETSNMIKYILNTFYNRILQNKYSNYEDKCDDIRYLISEADNQDLASFLDDVSTMRKEDKRKNKNSLTIITMHKAKGLEWDVVFIPFLDKNEYPRCRDKEYMHNVEAIKNERNLFYVGITRARKMLYLSYSMSYTGKPAGPSYFLEEIDENLYDADFFGKEYS